jgi:hypothetical protein
LTLGFARRFASYKRPNLLLRDPQRLVNILNNRAHPVQLVLAGKAHPQDLERQGMIRQWVEFSHRPEVKSRVVFLTDCDLFMAEQLAGRRDPTQFGRALQQLGVTYIAAQSPQVKGRIERLWGTFQDRLTSELRLAGSNDLDSSNQVLRRFLPDYNRRFARAPREAQTAWRPAPQNLDRICCFQHHRSVSNDNVVQWDGRRFQIPPHPRRFSFAGAKVQVVESLEGKVAIYYGENKLQHTEG